MNDNLEGGANGGARKKMYKPKHCIRVIVMLMEVVLIMTL